MQTKDSNSPIFASVIEGQNFKSYKALCLTLGIPVKAGSSKLAQLRKLEEFFVWTRGRVYYARPANSYRILKVLKPFPYGSSLPRKKQVSKRAEKATEPK